MGKYTKEDIVRFVEEEDVEFIRLQFVDIFGALKNMAVTISQLDQVLNNKCMFDGAAIDGFADHTTEALFLAPQLDSFTIFPWRPQQGKVARFICDVLYADGTPFKGDSRYILKQVLREAETLGYTFDVKPRCEFFLFDINEQGEATTRTRERGEYFDIGPLDEGENARREMVLFLEDMGFEIESSYHAKGAAQHSISFQYDDALHAADNIVTFKLAVRTVAKRHGLHATFMPKPRRDLTASEMCLGIRLCKDGKNIFMDEKNSNQMTKEAYYFIAGIIEHMEGMSFVCNPIVNSYKRLAARTHHVVKNTNFIMDESIMKMLSFGEQGTWLELRNADSASNPYLVLALCLAAGLDGIKRKIPFSDLQEKIENNQMLPTTLDDARKAFEKDEFLKEVAGAHIANGYVEVKKQEWNEYCEEVSEWEVKRYLNRI